MPITIIANIFPNVETLQYPHKSYNNTPEIEQQISSTKKNINFNIVLYFNKFQ